MDSVMFRKGFLYFKKKKKGEGTKRRSGVPSDCERDKFGRSKGEAKGTRGRGGTFLVWFCFLGAEKAP